VHPNPPISNLSILHPIITCEHAGNVVPKEYIHFFEGHEEILHSHKGWDPGALEMAEFLSGNLNVPLYKCETTRLLIEPNRSIASPFLFSGFTRGLPSDEKDKLLQAYYYPHRNEVEEFIEKSSERILHLSVHSFTPLWNGETRATDIGLLFDPARKSEVEFCARYCAEIKSQLPSFNIEFNEPYKGTDDGFTTHLRTLFEDEFYLGIEIETNQKYVRTKEWQTISTVLYNGLCKILARS
jgi:predicted N-formylglutamate amidohydrolase